MASRAKTVLLSEVAVSWLSDVVARSWALMRQGRALRSLTENQPARWCRLWRSNTTIWLRLIATMSLATSRRRT